MSEENMKDAPKKKMSSYQRMKQRHEEEVARLMADIHILVDGHDHQRIEEVKMKWRFTDLMMLEVDSSVKHSEDAFTYKEIT